MVKRRFYYTFSLTGWRQPNELERRGTYNIRLARKIAISLIKKYHESVTIYRNFKAYVSVEEGWSPKTDTIFYVSEYMDGEDSFLKNGPTMILNEDGSIKKTIRRQ